MQDVKIICFREHPDAVVPEVAYGGSSAAFDITCVKDIQIEPGCSGVVENGLRLSIPQNSPYYMHLQLRSSTGFKNDLTLHTGIIDAGYTGPLGVKIYNIGKVPVTFKAGDKYAQVLVHKKPSFGFVEMTEAEFILYKEQQERGDSGFGSSGKSIN